MFGYFIEECVSWKGKNAWRVTEHFTLTPMESFDTLEEAQRFCSEMNQEDKSVAEKSRKNIDNVKTIRRSKCPAAF